MGLDMYLSRKTYVKNWDHMKPEQLHKITISKGGKAVRNIKRERISYIEEQVMYWRKANAIHAWFVANVQNDVDDCGEYYVTDDNLKDLLEAVTNVLDRVEMIDGDIHTGTTYFAGELTENYEPGKIVSNPQICEDLLPSQSGFFFGGTDYDEWYIQDLKETKEELTKLLKEDNTNATFYYQSSW